MIKIGITSSIEISNSWPNDILGLDYISSVIHCGGCPIIIPPMRNKSVLAEYMQILDGIIFSGGSDVSPGLYYEKNDGLSINTSVERDETEFLLIEYAIVKKIPILGICRGMQILNVFFGGNLYQDLRTQHEGSILHANAMEIRTDIHHEVSVAADTCLSRITGRKIIPVNSRHHQGIKKAADNFRISATAPDGIAEAFEDIDHNIVAVQWHPENFLDSEESSRALFINLIQRAEYKKLNR